MSLRVDDERRGRSRSPGRRQRSRSPAMMESREPSYAYPEDDLDERDRYALTRRGDVPPASSSAQIMTAEPPGAFPGGGPPPGAYHGAPPGPPPGGAVPYPEDESLFPGGRSVYGYDDRRPNPAVYGQPPPSPGADGRYYRGSRDQVAQVPQSPYDDYRGSRDRFDDPRVRTADPPVDPRDARDPRASRDYRDARDHRDPREYRDPRDSRDARDPRRERRPRDDDLPPPSPAADDEDKLKFLPAKYAQGGNKTREGRDSDRDSDREKRRSARFLGEDDSPEKRSSRPKSPRPESPSRYKYSEPKPYEYGQPDERARRYGHDQRDDDESALTYGAGPYDKRDASPNPQAYPPSRQKQYYSDDPRASASVLTVEPGRDRRSSVSRRDRSPPPPTQRMSNLTVATAAPMGASLAAAPGSPLLESYRGTYQDMSPMPSPMLLPSQSTLSIEPASPLASDDERGGRRRRARFHDSEDVAERLARALKGSKAPDVAPLIEILPGLSHEEVMELRKDYKALVKTGSERKGVNIAKHVRSRLKDADPHLMKACYAVALGRWESEAYWANFWYQGDKTRRELLIESLMGRTNDEVRAIKDAFSDKKYDNSLVKCMKTELKEDKFKKAVLKVLDERRMDDVDSYGRPLPLDFRLVDQDVDDLRRAVKSEKGGESAMISIVVQRSDEHLREVLRTYEKDFRSNFARDALKKSGNLVGELLAHILNGVINKPVRDALLIHHALTASRRDGLRRELLTSRLVRYHWDRKHMEAVKRAYRERYQLDLQEAVRDGTSGEWGQFCYELCIYRMPNDVKQFERDAKQYERERERERDRSRDRR